MFLSFFGWNKSKQPVVSDSDLEKRLNEIKHILFPPLETNTHVSSDGKLVKYHIDYCIDSALETVLYDLQEDYNDAKCHETLNSIIKRLLLVRKLLNVETYIDKEAEYISVENLDLDQAVEDIR